MVARGAAFLDESFPLAEGSHTDATAYLVEAGSLVIETTSGTTSLKDPAQFAGYGRRHDPAACTTGCMPNCASTDSHPIGKTHAAGLADIVLESALTTIQDCEDSVAAVDAEDKVGVYRNWLGLMNGTLTETFEKGGQRR